MISAQYFQVLKCSSKKFLGISLRLTGVFKSSQIDFRKGKLFEPMSYFPPKYELLEFARGS